MNPPNPDWFASYDEALGEAKRLRKPVLLQFEREDCVGCQKLYAHTYTDPWVEKELASHFIPLKLNIRKDRRIRAQYSAVWTPSFYFLDYMGRSHHSLAGYVNAEDFRLTLRLAVAKIGIPRGRYDEAIRSLEDAIALFPDNPLNPTLRYWRIIARYLKNWDQQQMRADFEELKHKFPFSPEARMWPW